jgi:hypothetical protein
VSGPRLAYLVVDRKVVRLDRDFHPDSSFVRGTVPPGTDSAWVYAGVDGGGKSFTWMGTGSSPLWEERDGMETGARLDFVTDSVEVGLRVDSAGTRSLYRIRLVRPKMIPRLNTQDVALERPDGEGLWWRFQPRVQADSLMRFEFDSTDRPQRLLVRSGVMGQATLVVDGNAQISGSFSTAGIVAGMSRTRDSVRLMLRIDSAGVSSKAMAVDLILTCTPRIVSISTIEKLDVRSFNPYRILVPPGLDSFQLQVHAEGASAIEYPAGSPVIRMTSDTFWLSPRAIGHRAGTSASVQVLRSVQTRTNTRLANLYSADSNNVRRDTGNLAPAFRPEVGSYVLAASRDTTWVYALPEFALEAMTLGLTCNGAVVPYSAGGKVKVVFAPSETERMLDFVHFLPGTGFRTAYSVRVVRRR